MTNRILAIGGTGLLGLPVAKQLQLDGFEVDILTTNPENAMKKCGSDFKYIQGDVKNAVILQKIFEGYDSLHINLNSSSYKDLRETELVGCRNIAKSAAESDIKKITMISGLGVTTANEHIPFVKAKIDIETAIRDSGLPYTIFNCTHFFESIPLYIRNGKAMIMGQSKHKIHWLSAKDYAKMVSKSFKTTESDYKNYSLVGPEAFTLQEVLEKYVDQVDQSLKITHVPLGMMGFIATVTFNSKLKFVVDLMRYFDSTPEKYDPQKSPGLLGSADTTLDDWLKDQNSY